MHLYKYILTSWKQLVIFTNSNGLRYISDCNIFLSKSVILAQMKGNWYSPFSVMTIETCSHNLFFGGGVGGWGVSLGLL